MSPFFAISMCKGGSELREMVRGRSGEDGLCIDTISDAEDSKRKQVREF